MYRYFTSWSMITAPCLYALDALYTGTFISLDQWIDYRETGPGVGAIPSHFPLIPKFQNVVLFNISTQFTFLWNQSLVWLQMKAPPPPVCSSWTYNKSVTKPWLTNVGLQCTWRSSINGTKRINLYSLCIVVSCIIFLCRIYEGSSHIEGY